MDSNPYAPPTAVVADIGGPPGLKRRSVVLMLLLAVFTVGLYIPIWFLRRLSALNALDSPQKLAFWPPAAFLVLRAAVVVSEVVFGATGSRMPGALQISLADTLMSIVILFQCFKTKTILEDHLTPPSDGSAPMFTEQVRLSGILTFLFSIFYLQHIINTRIVDRR